LLLQTAISFELYDTVVQITKKMNSISLRSIR